MTKYTGNIAQRKAQKAAELNDWNAFIADFGGEAEHYNQRVDLATQEVERLAKMVDARIGNRGRYYRDLAALEPKLAAAKAELEEAKAAA